MRLANLLVEGEYFCTITIAFLIKGLTKNSCNRNFNAIKKDYHSTNIFTKDQALEVLGQSDRVTIVNANENFFNNLGELEGKLYKKYSNRTITKGYLFTVSTDNPAFVTVKSSIAIPLHIKEALLQGTSVLSIADIHHPDKQSTSELSGLIALISYLRLPYTFLSNVDS